MSDLITLNKNNEFRRVYSRGKSYVSPELVTYVNKTHKKDIRYGITAGKKVGNAVKRNRAKRVIRESYRLLEGQLETGFDIVFVARVKTSYCKSQKILCDMKSHLTKAGVLKDD